jgi:hypothetical protein
MDVQNCAPLGFFPGCVIHGYRLAHEAKQL